MYPHPCCWVTLEEMYGMLTFQVGISMPRARHGDSDLEGQHPVHFLQRDPAAGMGVHGSAGMGQPVRHVSFARPDSPEGHARGDHDQRDRAGGQDAQVLVRPFPITIVPPVTAPPPAVATVDIACRDVSMVFATSGWQ